MADKSSRGLVLYGDGLASFINSDHTHLHSLASRGCSGFLSLPHFPPSESKDERTVRELTYLLDACEADSSMDGKIASSGSKCEPIPNISDRFMGMKAVIITNNTAVKSFGEKLGFGVLQFKELLTDCEVSLELVTLKILELLGFQDGRAVEASQFDLVVVHIRAGEKADILEHKITIGDIELVDGLAGKVMHIAQPRSEIGSRLHLSVVMSYGAVSMEEDPSLSILQTQDPNRNDLSVLFPRQSYTMRGESPRKNVRHCCPMLVTQWQEAVTRKDMAETFSFKEFKEHGGNLVIPADRFLHEIAFKLWKAPKYGA
ncbi:hypothetical protein RJ641_022405 [Dillenia turbinata]|uniref:Uncharacterized protein n=1 Tax=Dillenia turbinata TaxID=194707 RepID=A0AAN8UF36_9MAGN